MDVYPTANEVDKFNVFQYQKSPYNAFFRPIIVIIYGIQSWNLEYVDL